MTDLWETVRQAAATKAATSAGCIAAGLRQSDTRIDDTNVLPALKWLWPALEMQDQTADTESYDLTFTAELIVARPSGKARSSPTWSAIARALQVEWRTGITLGLSASGVWYSGIVSVTPGLNEYQDTDLDGCTIAILVRIRETVYPSRSA
jgi:hypothetical protein